jgi:uncharacterized protein (TIGR00375 family)
VLIADLHIHSKYSRACSRDLELPTLARYAQLKGVTLVGTGDLTHPGWYQHLTEQLIPAEPGLFRLRDEPAVSRLVPPAARAPVRFQLSVEISTIYRRDDRTRKVHHLVYLPDLEAARRFNTALGRIGNLAADGRPILGLDSRDLLDIALTASDDAYLVPAHIWTPWFSALGSKSGFDAIADCYADLAEHIFAVETGLSSDPAMNWLVSALDRYRLVSNSDAHSPQALAREATVLDCPLDYFSVREAFRSGVGLAGTIEFFPEEGKYHADGHRACGVNWDPARTTQAGGVCPECGKPLTVGVLNRVMQLADRTPEQIPAGRPAVTHLVQLPQVLGEIMGVGPRSKAVTERLAGLVNALGPELRILTEAPPDDIGRHGGELLREAIGRLRAGRVHRIRGYDGEYGVIRLFEPSELASGGAQALFELPATRAAARVAAATRRPRRRQPKPTGPAKPGIPAATAPEPVEPMLAGMEEVGTGLLDRLDAMQRVAAAAPGGPLLIVAGPGTGKTRTLTHRIAYLCAELDVYPEECLAITFTTRAAEELRQRLAGLLGPVAEDVTVATFHSFGLLILRENPAAAGLVPGFRVADEVERLAALTEAAGAEADQQALRALDTDDALRERYAKVMRARNLVDFDELLRLPVNLLRQDPALAESYQGRWPWVFVDEYQDVDPVQYDLLRRLCPPGGNICAIGDPDQAIYAFRGASVEFFLRFAEDFGTPDIDARTVRLSRNYRSSAPILTAAAQAIAPATLVPGRRLDPAKTDPQAALIGHYPANSTADEADFVLRTVDELVGGVSHGSLDSGRVDARAVAQAGLGFSDIAVLYRTDAQAAAIVAALSRGGVPVRKRSHDRLTGRPAVPALARELRFTGTGSVSRRLLAARQTLLDRYATPTLDLDLTAPAVPDPADVYAAVELLGPLAESSGDDLEAFLAALATGAEVDAWDPRADAVTLLTLHAAKGLEFPVVFIVGCEDGLIPLRPGGGAAPISGAEVAEERRLFFVGLTRAQDRLFVSHTRRRPPSPFLASIDNALLDNRGEDLPRPPRDVQLRLI